jgi:hypothetical protein
MHNAATPAGARVALQQGALGGLRANEQPPRRSDQDRIRRRLGGDPTFDGIRALWTSVRK